MGWLRASEPSSQGRSSVDFTNIAESDFRYTHRQRWFRCASEKQQMLFPGHNLDWLGSMHGRQGRRVGIIKAFRVAEPAGALANSPRAIWGLTSAASAVWVRIDIEDDVIRVGRVRNT